MLNVAVVADADIRQAVHPIRVVRVAAHPIRVVREAHPTLALHHVAATRPQAAAAPTARLLHRTAATRPQAVAAPTAHHRHHAAVIPMTHARHRAAVVTLLQTAAAPTIRPQRTAATRPTGTLIVAHRPIEQRNAALPLTAWCVALTEALVQRQHTVVNAIHRLLQAVHVRQQRQIESTGQ